MRQPPIDKITDKIALRSQFRDRRRVFAAVSGHAAAQALVSCVLDVLRQATVEPPAIIAAYYPLADEISPLPLLAELRQQGYRTALPVTSGRDAGLTFRLCDQSSVMARSAFGVMEPTTGAAVRPDVVLVPLLGFDAACQRLGHGAGHYDRTLAHLRQHGGVLSIGLAFDMQRTASLPSESHDQPLDCVVTEKAVYRPVPISLMKG